MREVCADGLRRYLPYSAVLEKPPERSLRRLLKRVDPENMDCAWQLIYDRMKMLGRLDDLEKIQKEKDWSYSRDGGFRKIVREDMLLEATETHSKE